MVIRSTWILLLGLAAVATACTGGSTPTPAPSPTASPRASSSAAPTPSAAPKAEATRVASPSAAAPSLPTFRTIDSIQACLDAVALTSTLDLPRQILSVTPSSIHDGDSVTISAVGYRPNTALEVRAFIPGTNRVSQPLAQTLSTEAGRASATFAIRSVRLLNEAGDPNVPICLGIVLWSPTEVGGAISFVVPER